MKVIQLPALILALMSSVMIANVPLAAHAAESLFESKLEADTFLSFGDYIDQNGQKNIKEVYLPQVSEAYAVSKSKKLSDELKKKRLNKVLENAHAYLEFQKDQPGYVVMAAFANYKLNKFKEAIDAGDYAKTADMASSAHYLASFFVK